MKISVDQAKRIIDADREWTRAFDAVGYFLSSDATLRPPYYLPITPDYERHREKEVEILKVLGMDEVDLKIAINKFVYSLLLQKKDALLAKLEEAQEIEYNGEVEKEEK